MDADTPRDTPPASSREPSAPSGWVTTQQAAKALGVSPRTVRWHIDKCNLDAKAEGEGVRRSWLVSIDSLQALRDTRQAAATSPGDHRVPNVAADIAAESPGNAIRELADRLVEEASRAAEFRVRLELSERAESTLRGELEEERRRREEAERKAEDLERRLRERQEAAQVPEEVPEGSEEPRSAMGGGHAATEPTETANPRPWWRRVFGG